MSDIDGSNWEDKQFESGDVDELPDQSAQDTSSDSSAETDMQVEEATTRLGAMPEIQPANWDQQDATQRLETLQTVENEMADIQGRPGVKVEMAEMPANTFGQFDGHTIQINADTLSDHEMPASEFVDTILHEGRHAYQNYSVENPGFDSDKTQVAAWAENLKPGNYLTAEEYGQEMYMNQPIEADAWQYASRITSGLYKKT